MNVSRQIVIRTAAKCGLGGLSALAAVAATTHDGSSTGTSLTRMAKRLGIDRHSFTSNMDRVAACGFVSETRTSRNKCWRRIARAEGDGIQIATETMEMLARHRDAAALAILMGALANKAGRFLVELPTLMELSQTSRNTLKSLLARVEAAGLAKVTKKSWRFFDIHVPEGTFPAPQLCQKTTEVRPSGILDMRARALALIRRLGRA